MNSPIRGFLPHLRTQAQNRGKCVTLCVQVLGHVKPHGRPFPGMLDCHPRSASGRSGCSLLSFTALLSPFCRAYWAVVVQLRGPTVTATAMSSPARMVRVSGS
jgi:hypothetical protein